MTNRANLNTTYQVIFEIISVFLFFIVYFSLLVPHSSLLTSHSPFFTIFFLWVLFVIFGYLWGEFSPTVSIYFGINYRTQIIYITVLISYIFVYTTFEQTNFKDFLFNKINIYAWLGIWVYFNFIAPVIGLMIRHIFPIPAVLVTNKKYKEKLLKWWGYDIGVTILQNQFTEWLNNNSNQQGKIDKYKIILIDETENQEKTDLSNIANKYFTDFISIKSYDLIHYLSGLHTRVISKFPGRGFQYCVKRLIDYTISIFVLFVSAPLFLFLVICIKLDSPGPVFYKHRRLGKNMHPFDLLKFRTMYQDADKRLEHILASNKVLRQEYQKTFKLKKDPRITRIGKIIRQLSIDETPQIINVIKGDMSLVGPRPIIEKEISFYQNYSLELFRVLPGVSGLWQTSGRTETTYYKRVTLDTQYVRSWSLFTDLKLLLKTIPAVLSQKGAY